MEPGEQEDDLIHYMPTSQDEGNADTHSGRSRRLGQQRADFNISPPTIPRSDTANIFPGGAFSSTSGTFQPFSRGRTAQFTQQSAQGQIPSYSQRSLSSHQEEMPSSHISWQSRIIPQTQFFGSRQHYFTPLHSSSNEESKLPASINPVSPVGVNSPAGFVNFTSPLQQLEQQRQLHTPVPPEQSNTERPSSVPTIGIATSESTDSGTRSRQKRNRRTPTQRKSRTPLSQDSARFICQPVDSKSPPPQNLRGDPFRSAKVKTELCRNFMSGKGCAFGDKCNYAHGEHELKYTKLMDLERAGLVDVEIFRTHPCPTWIATGACPFDQRCIGIHDPRVEGHPAQTAWLPHAETLINKIGVGNNIDKFFHERLASLYNPCPIYGYIPMEISNNTLQYDESLWRHFYDFICNADSKSILDSNFDLNRHILRDLAEEHRLEIVLKMRQRKSSQLFAYLPTHLFCGELCMILQERTFQLFPNRHSKMELREVQGDSKISGNEIIFKAYEIAFGPVGDPTVRPPSVWFDIPKDDISPCTPQQAKHHKRSRHRIKKAPKDTLIGERFKSLRIPPFSIYQPIDHASFDLITSVLVHRLKVTKLFSGKFDNSIEQVSQILASEQENLKRQYLSLFQFWIFSSWPEEELSSPINDFTDVPPVSMKYTCEVNSKKYLRSKECFGLASKRHLYDLKNHSKMFPCFLWKSFITNIMIQRDADPAHIRRESITDYDDIFHQLRRLPALRRLSMGDRMYENRILPHIRTSRGVGPYSLSQCIEDLYGEWEELKAHYNDEKSGTISPFHTTAFIDENSDSQMKDRDVAKASLTMHLNNCIQQWTRMHL